MFPFRKIYKGVKRLFRRKRKGAKPKRKALARPTGYLTVKKTIINPRINILSNGTTFAADTFELSDIPQVIQYAQLYEEFRINKVVYSWKSFNNAAPNFVNTGTVTSGLIHSIVDMNDDITAGMTLQTMANDPSYKVTRMTQFSHTRTIYLKFMNIVGDSNGPQNNALQQAKGWLKCVRQSDNVINPTTHYGIKYAFEGGINSAGNYTCALIEPQMTFYVSFRNPQ